MTSYRLKRKKPQYENIIYADTHEECERVVRRLWDSRIVGVDTETVGPDLKKYHPKGQQRAVCMTLATLDGARVFVPLWGKHANLLRTFQPWLEGSNPTKVLHGGKFDMHVFANHGVTMDGLLGDTMVMDFCYDSGQTFHNLEDCCQRYFGDAKTSFRETFGQRKVKRNGELGKQIEVPPLTEVVETPEGINRLVQYAARDPEDTVKLYMHLANELNQMEWVKGASMLDYYSRFEVPYTGVLFRMERRGCLLNVERLSSMQEQLAADIEGLDRKFAKTCAQLGVPPSYIEKFNMGSTVQVGDLIERQLGGEIVARTPTGRPSTDDAALMEVRGPARAVVKVILERRRLEKLLGTYVDPFLHLSSKYEGRVHTNLKQIGTQTMRLSSSAPNLQNIPSAGKDHYGIRGAFVAPQGMVVGDIDLSQIEMRLMAHFTQDEMMLKALREGWDLHSLTATKTDSKVRQWMGARTVDAKLLKEVKEQFEEPRRRAKTLNFGIGYGMGAKKYAQMTGVSERAGYEAIDGFFSLYPGLRNGIRDIQRGCVQRGYVRTLLRRVLKIPGITSEVMGVRKAAERQAFNYVIQGSAADLLKMSMTLIDRDSRLKELGVQMTLQIHDELLFEVPKGAEKEIKPIIEQYVSQPYRVYGMKDLRVETPADLGFGASWAEAKG